MSVDNLDEGQTYYFVVTAFDADGTESETSNEASYTVSGIAPPAGSPFIVQVLSSDTLTLGWNSSPSANVQGYYVYYGKQSGVYDNVLWVEGNQQVDVPSLIRNVTYYFAVTTKLNSGEESRPTPEISYTVPVLAPPQAAPGVTQIFPSQDLLLSWNPSPSTDVAGYIISYGTQSGIYDSQIWVGPAMSMDFSGLLPEQTYFFTITAYDNTGVESDYSPEAACYLHGVSVDLRPVLSLQPTPVPGFPNAFAVTATGTLPPAWTLEGSPDLETWSALATGTEQQLNVSVVVSEKPALFFRLNNWFADFPLNLDTSGANRYSGSFVVSTDDFVPWNWTLESSEDLQKWNPLVTGYYSPVKVAIINAPTPQLYFRLKGQ